MYGKSTRQFLPCWIGCSTEMFITQLSFIRFEASGKTFYIPDRCEEVWMGPEFTDCVDDEINCRKNGGLTDLSMDFEIIRSLWYGPEMENR